MDWDAFDADAIGISPVQHSWTVVDGEYRFATSRVGNRTCQQTPVVAQDVGGQPNSSGQEEKRPVGAKGATRATGLRMSLAASTRGRSDGN